MHGHTFHGVIWVFTSRGRAQIDTTNNFVLRLDHLGTWVLGCIPVQSPESRKVGPVGGSGGLVEKLT